MSDCRECGKRLVDPGSKRCRPCYRAQVRGSARPPPSAERVAALEAVAEAAALWRDTEDCLNHYRRMGFCDRCRRASLAEDGLVEALRELES